MPKQACGRATAACSLVLLVLIHQVCSHPVPDSVSTHLQNGWLLKRTARMSPLWRIMGTKPHGAYCKYNNECSTGMCSGGHCSFSQPIKS